jgi:hypothetical protein
LRQCADALEHGRPKAVVTAGELFTRFLSEPRANLKLSKRILSFLFADNPEVIGPILAF